MNPGDIYTDRGKTNWSVMIAFVEKDIIFSTSLKGGVPFRLNKEDFDKYYTFNQKLTDLYLIKDIIE